MKRQFAIPLLFLSCSISAQTIGHKDIERFHKDLEKDENITMRQNAIIGETDLKNIALNHKIQTEFDHLFKYRVDVKGITDQQSSGRCWMFTSLNVIRPAIMERYDLSSFDFSHNYLYFWDLLEKSNLFLENIIRTSGEDIDDREVVFYFKSPVSDGGVWNLFYNLSSKYGFVPKEIMPETAHSNNTRQLTSILNELLRRDGYRLRKMAEDGKSSRQLQNEKNATLSNVYKILCLTLGVPPTEFDWKYETKSGEVKTLSSTPMKFYKDNTPRNYSPDQYIMIMNDPTRPYYQVYDIANYRNTIEGINWRYLNLPNEDIKESAIESIKNNEAMYASCDVGKQFNRATGILDPDMYDFNALLGVDLDMDKEARILTRQSGSAHAMSIIAVDTDRHNKPIKWEFENSWGASSGHNGYLTFTDAWFDEYLFRIVIRKEFLSKKAIEALDKEPIQLPCWDYMF